jgi:8-oxo-dGTP pyrophosphatase MutT (NUDIX family)
MFFDQHMVEEAVSRYGLPRHLRLNYPTPREHYDFIRSTQKHGRAHDVTLYLYHHNRLAVTRKPMYPKGAYRPPSGGLHPGETLEEGAAREGWEELGVHLLLDRYLLCVRVDFVYGRERIRWTTHVFQAKLESDEDPSLDPKDHEEIVEAVWADEADFFGPMRRGLLSVGSTGLLYRVHLHDYIRRKFSWGNPNNGSNE